MASERFDVTFIRGPRDVAPWKEAARRMTFATNSPQVELDALQARRAYGHQRDGLRLEQYPNAIYQEKGRERRCTK